ncbi:hypothetical protein CC86DRAFT_375058 [Ophiobolus disseminans]|uniref:Uncharacterized protein n=1 Tax=Ophiobolus disseminans TaxID=1469910 RepID=A0A6A6ZFC8_9PLEO|nr:hypothetical protein CC86DRAFT_375058 [Ophiobolus disseminans]
MTPGIVRALDRAEAVSPDDFAELHRADEPTLADPKPGNPVSHSQLIDLSRLLKMHAEQISTTESQRNQATISGNEDSSKDDEQTTTTTDPIPTSLSSLLHRTTIYTPPPPTPRHQTPQYTALMSRLRAAEEARSYERMLHPPPTRESFTQRFPSAAPFSLGSSAPADSPDNDATYEEVHRQIILIINILVSIVCVAVFIWVAARHWSVGKRLGLSMAGSFGIAIAEVVVYGGYVRKVEEAKRTERRKPEVKEIVRSWVLFKGGEEESVGLDGNGKAKEGDGGDGVRRRKGRYR